VAEERASSTQQTQATELVRLTQRCKDLQEFLQLKEQGYDNLSNDLLMAKTELRRAEAKEQHALVQLQIAREAESRAREERAGYSPYRAAPGYRGESSGGGGGQQRNEPDTIARLKIIGGVLSTLSLPPRYSSVSEALDDIESKVRNIQDQPRGGGGPAGRVTASTLLQEAEPDEAVMSHMAMGYLTDFIRSLAEAIGEDGMSPVGDRKKEPVPIKLVQSDNKALSEMRTLSNTLELSIAQLQATARISVVAYGKQVLCSILGILSIYGNN